MEDVFVEKDTILLDTAVAFALLLKSMTQHIEFVMFLVKTTKSGIPSFVPVGAFLVTT